MWETLIKTTVKYHLTPVRTAITKKTTNNKQQHGCEEKPTLQHFGWNVNGATTTETVWRLPRKEI